MFIDLESVKAAEHLFRNYDLEWEFIKEMDKMCGIKFDAAILIHDSNPRMVGENWIIVYEAVNDNKFGEV